MVSNADPITRSELNAEIKHLATKEDIGEIKGDIRWMRWAIGVILPIALAATIIGAVAELVMAIKS